MAVIRGDQMKAFGAAQEKACAERAAAYLRTQFPDHCSALGETRVAESVAIALSKREEHRFDTEEMLLLYLDVMYLLSFDFDTSDAYPWAKALLSDPDLGAPTRLTMLNERAWEEARKS